MIKQTNVKTYRNNMTLTLFAVDLLAICLPMSTAYGLTSMVSPANNSLTTGNRTVQLSQLTFTPNVL